MDGIRSLRESVGVPRLLFGTDLPFILAESPIMELGDARLSDEEDAAIRYRSAAAALGLE
jgi:predicted TIM-barrel fold metal-dependent hydrolase